LVEGWVKALGQVMGRVEDQVRDQVVALAKDQAMVLAVDPTQLKDSLLLLDQTYHTCISCNRHELTSSTES